MISGSSLVLFAAVSVSLCDDGHEMEEFLKREYSLSKPYQGKRHTHIHTPSVHHSSRSASSSSSSSLYHLHHQSDTGMKAGCVFNVMSCDSVVRALR